MISCLGSFSSLPLVTCVVTVAPGSEKDLEKIERGRHQFLQVNDFDVHQALKARKCRYNGTSPKGK